MTDAEIKKALVCHTSNSLKTCGKCPLFNVLHCASKLSGNALGLINRQQAEVERLNKEVDRLSQIVLYHDAHIADAIKEFAELSIKRFCENVTAPTPTESYIVERCNQELDNLLKEMVGEG